MTNGPEEKCQILKKARSSYLRYANSKMVRLPRQHYSLRRTWLLLWTRMASVGFSHVVVISSNLIILRSTGTDATIAQHIQTIIDREYVIERMDGATKHLMPSTLGIGLIEGYNEIGFERSLSKPQLRRETERGMVRVCEGAKSKAEMLTESIEQYREMYVLAKREFDKVVTVGGLAIHQCCLIRTVSL